MTTPDFLRPKLVGKRFEDHSLPFELLGDLAVLEPMIIDAAKWIYLQDNPGRVRSPRNFAEGISLNLASIQEGSAVAEIALSLGTEHLIRPERDYIVRARDAVVHAITAAGANQPPTEHLPPTVLAYFDRLGRSLRDGEAIEFPTAVPGMPARLTKATRLRLLRAAKVQERTEEIHIRGGIHEADQTESTFELKLNPRDARLYNGSKIPGPISKPHLDSILNAFHEYQRGVKVRIDGVGKFNGSNRLLTIESIDQIALLDPLDFESQLEELKSLEDGWLDGKGVAPASEGLDWLSRTFNEHYSDNLALPYVYPVAEGGVRLEWSIGRRELSLEIDLGNRRGEWHSLDLETDDEKVGRLNLDAANDWIWMMDRLQPLNEDAS